MRARRGRRQRRVTGGCRRRGKAWGSHVDVLRKKEHGTEHGSSRPVIPKAWGLEGIAGSLGRQALSLGKGGILPRSPRDATGLAVTLRWSQT